MPTRRDLLADAALAAAVGALLSPSFAAALNAPPLATRRAFFRIRAATDARTVFWYTQGVKYLLTTDDLAVVPLHQFGMISALRTDRGDMLDDAGATVLLRTLEGGMGLDLDTGALAKDFVNPLTGEREPIATSAARPLAYAFDGQGRHGFGADDPRRAASSISGTLHARSMIGPAGAHGAAVEEIFAITAKTAAGETRTLRELNTYITDADDDGGSSAPAVRKRMVVLRNWTGGGNRPALSVSTYEGRKFATLDEALAAAGPERVAAAQPEFVRQARGF
ncbi:MAG: hypothetical protein SFV21_00725 [Rhodospirillaceae bacterium]|nr:hypothetical protein [Rhodospirillaceae bacterium]